MEALGQLSPVARVEAEIQGYAAEFLGMKLRLIKLQNSVSLQVRSKAAGLYAVQQQLEGELKTNLANIERAKVSGSWDFGNIVQISEFTSRLVKHMNNVKSLEREGLIIQPTGIQQGPDMGVVVGMVGALLLFTWYMTSK